MTRVRCDIQRAENTYHLDMAKSYEVLVESSFAWQALSENRDQGFVHGSEVDFRPHFPAVLLA